VVSGSIPSREIVSLLDGKLTRWSSASYVPKRKEIKYIYELKKLIYMK
jgi:hypothetical protein